MFCFSAKVVFYCTRTKRKQKNWLERGHNSELKRLRPFSQQMGKTVATQPIRLVVILTQFMLVGWFLTFGLCSLEDVHKGKYTCLRFGHTRIRITCTGIKQVPRDLSSNTAMLLVL